MTTPRFLLRAVSKSFADNSGGRLAVLSGVDLALPEQEISALVGCSGAGKSTLARVAMGWLRPDNGEVLYQGRPLAEAPRAAFCRGNQLVLQNPLLAVNPCHTVEQIVGEPLRTLKLGHDAAGRRRAVAAVLAALELPQRCRQRRPGELSGGELQRVVLARALLPEPEFLVLDEPFSALDELRAERLVRLLQALLRRRRLGALLISHHRRHVQALADRVHVLEQGRIAGAADQAGRNSWR